MVALLTSKPFLFSVVVKAELVLWDRQLPFWHPGRTKSISGKHVFHNVHISLTKATRNRISETFIATFHRKQLICLSISSTSLHQFPLLVIVFYGDLRSFRLARWFFDHDWVHPAIFLGWKRPFATFCLYSGPLFVKSVFCLLWLSFSRWKQAQSLFLPQWHPCTDYGTRNRMSNYG